MGTEGVVRHRATTNRTLGDHIADGSRSSSHEETQTIGILFYFFRSRSTLALVMLSQGAISEAIDA
jgi:hypothetical protein